MIRACILAALILGMGHAELDAQLPGATAPDSAAMDARQDTIPQTSVEDRVRKKLRALEAASRPEPPLTDSTAAVADRDSVGAVRPGTGEPADSTTPATGAVPQTVPTDSTDSARKAGGVPGKADPRPTPPAPDTLPAAVSDTVADTVRDTISDTARAERRRRRVVPDSVRPVRPSEPTDTTAPATGPEIRFGTSPSLGVIPAKDSVVARLRALEGYVVTEYRAANARYDGESGELVLVGEPHLVRGGESMKADSLLRYDQRTSIVCGYGKPVLSGTGNDPVESDEVCYDVDRQVGVALGARTTFQQQGTWYIHGSELYTSGTNRVYGSATSFTSCDLEEPHYHFSATEMKVVHNSVMVARNVTLRFADVPVFWLPFIVQSLKPDRRSGLLTPTLGLQHVVRTSSGYRREIRDIGIYWAINQNLGLTTAMDWQSGGYVALRGRLQYRWLRQFLGGDINFGRYWEEGGRTRFTIAGNTNWQPGERTTLRGSVNYASSNDFVRRYSVDPEELNRSIDSNLGLSHRFGWGSLNLTGSRRQHLSNDQVDLTLPSVSLTLNPVTLFPAGADPKWFNNGTWQSNFSFTSTSREVDILRPSERGQNQSTLQGRADTRITLGKLSWNAGFDFNESLLRDRPTWYDPNAPDTVAPDSIVYNRTVGQTMGWRTGLSLTQRLIENTHISPSVTLSGGMQLPTGLPDSLGISGRVAEPTRLNMGASLQTNIFGFWPGVGPYSRIRHRLEPSLNYTYSPTPHVTDLQRQAFGTRYDALRESNQLSLTVRQTFEAKPVRKDTARSSSAQDTVTGTFGEVPPRRVDQVQPITLLSISSSALVYDFARQRDGEYGLVTTQMSHSIRSDLVRGLSLSVGHDLFRLADRSQADSPRTFAPRLRNVNAQFSLSSDSWPFRLFASKGEEVAAGGDPAEMTPADSAALMQDEDISRSIMPGQGSGRSLVSGGNQQVGTWRGDFNYSMTRPPLGLQGDTNQMVTATISFQPTRLWNVRWSTGYSFTTGEFSDHVLSLTRDLHRWRASFYFARTQTGSFAFRLNVQLMDNPDIKVDYDQRSQAPPSHFR